MNAPNAPNPYIIDWFKRHGMDESFNAREKMLHQPYPKEKYQPTAQQNIILLKWLKENYGP